jgi:hypothetical protein
VIRYDPKELLKKIAPKAKIKKLLSSKLTLKKAALSFVSDIDALSKDSVRKVALKTIKSYQQRRAKEVVEAGMDRAAGQELAKEIVKNPKLLIQQVQNEVVWQISQEIKTQYRGESYIWLPSDASEPDPEHALNYGKTFTVGAGEMPGERIGCLCGMQIITDDTRLEL